MQRTQPHAGPHAVREGRKVAHVPARFLRLDGAQLTLKGFLLSQCRTCNSNACGIYIKSRGHHR